MLIYLVITNIKSEIVTIGVQYDILGKKISMLVLVTRQKSLTRGYL